VVWVCPLEGRVSWMRYAIRNVAKLEEDDADEKRRRRCVGVHVGSSRFPPFLQFAEGWIIQEGGEVALVESHTGRSIIECWWQGRNRRTGGAVEGGGFERGEVGCG
jgi:hypothetical protein